MEINLIGEKMTFKELEQKTSCIDIMLNHFSTKSLMLKRMGYGEFNYTNTLINVG